MVSLTELQNRPSVLSKSLNDLTQLPEKPLGPVAQGAKPPRASYPAGPAGTYNLNSLAEDIRTMPGPGAVLGKIPPFVGTGIGQLYDMQRAGLVLAAGGDPASVEGGPDKYAIKGRSIGQGISEGIGNFLRQPARAVLEATGAAMQPAGTGPLPASNPSGAEQASQSQVATPPVPAKPAAPASAQNSAQSISLDGGITAGREPGKATELSNIPGRQENQQALGTLGDGVGGLSVMSGGREGMMRNLLATEIMQQGRRERRNPNYLTVVGDSSREISRSKHPLDRVLNDRANRVEADARDAREESVRDDVAAGATRIAGLQQQLDQSLQQGVANERSNAAASRLDDLTSALANPDLPADQRERLERAYGALTVPAKDRYIVQDAVLGQDNMGAPITGKVALDVLTGTVVGGQQPRQQYQVGQVYQNGRGEQRRYNGTDASGNPVWEEL